MHSPPRLTLFSLMQSLYFLRLIQFHEVVGSCLVSIFFGITTGPSDDKNDYRERSQTVATGVRVDS